MEKDIILCESIISQHGCYKRIRRWIKGTHPERGIIIFGFTGPETIIDMDVIEPKYYFFIKD